MTGTPQEEIRFAVVLNGGVSLAVWMGGVVLELDRLTRSDGAYAGLLKLLGCTARADVITGTSAGGINGAALALSQVNANAKLSNLRDLWVEQGRFEELLRQPFHGQPASLLRGDEFFLPKIHMALDQLTHDFQGRSPKERPIDLRITTTLLNGVQKVTYDDLGQALTQTIHQGSFTFRRDPDTWAHPPESRGPRDDFQADKLPKLVEQLALAARSTASFPFAFEPSFVRVGGTGSQLDMDRVASWSKAATDRSRFAVDGGVLVNTPTKEALEAIDRLPADDPVRRVMLLVFPHAPAAGKEPDADKNEKAPTIVATGGRLLSAMYSQSGRTYVEKVEEHNRAAASRRGGRSDLLNRLENKAKATRGANVVTEVYQLAENLYDHYKDVRIRHAAREVTTRQFDVPEADYPGWSFERTRGAAEDAQRKFGPLPYVPAQAPPAVTYGRGAGWPWGFAMAESLASAALDLLKRLVWVVKSEQDIEEIKAARWQLHEARCTIGNLREQLDGKWRDEQPTDLDSAYWTARLRFFKERMVEKDDAEGAGVRAQVMQIGKIVDDAQKLFAEAGPRLESAGLTAWRELLADDFSTDSERAQGWTGEEDRAKKWISRLLALEISTTCLADSPPAALDQPLELVQVSLQTKNAFAEHTITPDDKAGGASLARFSGFLKRSWRVNDWIWGRLDAATMLCKIVFDPELLRRQDLLDPREGQVPAQRAEAFMRQLVKGLFGGRPQAEHLQKLADRATGELTGIYTAQSSVDCKPTADALAELAAWGLHVRIILDELPALRSAIHADALDGANPRSRGELFIAEHDLLLDRIARLPKFEDDPATYLKTGLEALVAFDRAGIGREPLKDEVSSDAMIRTTATATAVAVTVLDSEKSGIGVAKPVTRALRGGALLPYWMVMGLTKGSRMAQGVALIAGTLGIAMLILAMFTLLPEWATAPAAATGTGLVLTMFGYSALRSGTLLHGLVLLIPVVPLVAYALAKWTAPDPAKTGTETEAATAAVSLGGIVAAVLFLMLLGSLPAVRQTPLALLFDKWRRILAFLVVLAALGGGIWALVAFQVVPMLVDVVRGVSWQYWWLLIISVLAMGLALWQGTRLKVWQRLPERKKAAPALVKWRRQRAEHPAAATAGWAAVYSIVLLAIGLSLGQWRLLDRFDERHWMTDSTVAVTLVFGLALALITPWYVSWRARRKIRLQLTAKAETALYKDKDREKVEKALLTRLTACGLLCDYLVKPVEPGSFELRAPGRNIAKKICADLALPEEKAGGAPVPPASSQQQDQAIV